MMDTARRLLFAWGLLASCALLVLWFVDIWNGASAYSIAERMSDRAFWYWFLITVSVGMFLISDCLRKGMIAKLFLQTWSVGPIVALVILFLWDICTYQRGGFRHTTEYMILGGSVIFLLVTASILKPKQNPEVTAPKEDPE